MKRITVWYCLGLPHYKRLRSGHCNGCKISLFAVFPFQFIDDADDCTWAFCKRVNMTLKMCKLLDKWISSFSYLHHTGMITVYTVHTRAGSCARLQIFASPFDALWKQENRFCCGCLWRRYWFADKTCDALEMPLFPFHRSANHEMMLKSEFSIIFIDFKWTEFDAAWKVHI